jgi:hypothetical protein
MAETKTSQQVNTDFSKYPELLMALDDMVEADGTDRSKFIRNLVRQEHARRAKVQPELPLFPPQNSGKRTAKSVAA